MEAGETLKLVPLQVQEPDLVLTAMEFITVENFVVVQVDSHEPGLGEVSQLSDFVIAQVDRSKVRQASGVLRQELDGLNLVLGNVQEEEAGQVLEEVNVFEGVFLKTYGHQRFVIFKFFTESVQWRVLLLDGQSGKSKGVSVRNPLQLAQACFNHFRFKEHWRLLLLDRPFLRALLRSFV